MIDELHSTDRRPGERVRQPRRQQAHWWRAHQLWSYIGPLRREANCASWLHNVYLEYLNTFQTLDDLLTMQKQMDTCTFGYHIFCRRHILPIIFWTSHISYTAYFTRILHTLMRQWSLGDRDHWLCSSIVCIAWRYMQAFAIHNKSQHFQMWTTTKPELRSRCA